MVKIILPAGWTEGRPTEFEIEAGLLPEVMRRFTEKYPLFRSRLFGPEAQLLTYVNLCLDSEVVPRHLRATTVVEPDSTIVVMAPMAGG